MPAIFFLDGFKFHFYSSEGEPRELAHVHVAKRGLGDAKLWLYPDVTIAYSYGLDARTERWITSVVQSRRTEIVDAWNEHFGTGDEG